MIVVLVTARRMLYCEGRRVGLWKAGCGFDGQ